MSEISLNAQRNAGSRASIFPITPHDDNALAVPAKGIVFKTAGALKILDGNGAERTIPSGVLAVGVIHNIQVTKVFAAGTTAADIWGVS